METQQTETEPKQEKQPQVVPQPIAVKEGSLAPTDNSQLVRIVQLIAKGGGFPERFDTLEKQIASYNLAHALMRDKWQIALNNIAIIKGSMMIYGELPSALAEQTKEVAEKKLFCIDREFNEICIKHKNLDAEPYAGVCIIQRKGREKKEFTYTIEEAKKAGQYPAMKPEYQNNRRTGNMIPNEDSPWMKFTKVMLMRKAMNMAVKFEFADALLGAPIAEDFDFAPDLIKDVTPASNSGERAKELNARFASENEPAEIQ
jgi:hypothetical protein